MSNKDSASVRSTVSGTANLSTHSAAEHRGSLQVANTPDQVSWFGWCRNGRGRIAGHFAQTADVWLPATPEHAPALAAVKRAAPKLATVRFCNGEVLVVAVNEKHEAYLYSCVHGSADTPRIAWFETIDGCFIGLNLAQLNAVFWHQPGSTAPAASDWDPTRLVVHFADKQAIALHQITGDSIERFRGATLSKHRATTFCKLCGQDDAAVSISIENMTYITMPASWLGKD